MLAFMDESGNPHPNDPSTRPTIVAICLEEKDSRAIGRRLYAMKRDLLGPQRAETELKGKKLLRRKTYESSRACRAFAEDFFAALRNWEITIFAVILRAPFNDQPTVGGFLDMRFRYLLQRVELLASERDCYANVLFDGRGDQFKDLSRRFSGYLFRSNEGRASTHIADTPAFVDSATSAGIQIADMCAYAMRVYEENQLHATPPSQDDEYQRAVRSWYRYIESQTRNLPSTDGVTLYGLHRLPAGVR